MRPERRRKSKESEPSGVGVNSIESEREDVPSSHKPSNDEIRLRAYEIYLERGGLPGDEIDDWLLAERELSCPVPHEARRAMQKDADQ